MKRILFEGACLAIVQIVSAANSQQQTQADSIYAPMHLNRHADLKEELFEGASDDEMRAYRDSYALHYAMPRQHLRHQMTHHAHEDIAEEHQQLEHFEQIEEEPYVVHHRHSHPVDSHDAYFEHASFPSTTDFRVPAHSFHSTKEAALEAALEYYERLREAQQHTAEMGVYHADLPEEEFEHHEFHMRPRGHYHHQVYRHHEEELPEIAHEIQAEVAEIAELEDWNHHQPYLHHALREVHPRVHHSRRHPHDWFYGMDDEEIESEIESQYVPEDEYSQVERALRHQHRHHRSVRPHIVHHAVPEKPAEEDSDSDSADELKEMDELIHPSYLVQKEEKTEKKEPKKEKASPKEATPKPSADSKKKDAPKESKKHHKKSDFVRSPHGYPLQTYDHDKPLVEHPQQHAPEQQEDQLLVDQHYYDQPAAILSDHYMHHSKTKHAHHHQKIEDPFIQPPTEEELFDQKRQAMVRELEMQEKEQIRFQKEQDRQRLAQEGSDRHIQKQKYTQEEYEAKQARKEHKRRAKMLRKYGFVIEDDPTFQDQTWAPLQSPELQAPILSYGESAAEKTPSTATLTPKFEKTHAGQPEFYGPRTMGSLAKKPEPVTPQPVLAPKPAEKEEQPQFHYRGDIRKYTTGEDTPVYRPWSVPTKPLNPQKTASTQGQQETQQQPVMTSTQSRYDPYYGTGDSPRSPGDQSQKPWYPAQVPISAEPMTTTPFSAEQPQPVQQPDPQKSSGGQSQASAEQKPQTPSSGQQSQQPTGQQTPAASTPTQAAPDAKKEDEHSASFMASLKRLFFNLDTAEQQKILAQKNDINWDYYFNSFV